MNELLHQLNVIFRHNKDGSYSTQANRRRILIMIMRELYQLGYELKSPHNLKPKHVYKLIDYWKAKKLSYGTMKNRISHIRWILKKVSKSSIIPRTNKELGIPNRTKEKKTKLNR